MYPFIRGPSRKDGCTETNEDNTETRTEEDNTETLTMGFSEDLQNHLGEDVADQCSLDGRSSFTGKCRRPFAVESEPSPRLNGQRALCFERRRATIGPLGPWRPDLSVLFWQA